MKENKIKDWLIKTGDALVEKIKELKDQSEIGKCIRTATISGAVLSATYIICKNGGINYNDKLLIGCSKNKI